MTEPTRPTERSRGDTVAPCLTAAGALSTDGYFLSSRNPVCNVDQREIENLAIELIARPDVQQAREKAGFLWRAVMEHPAGAQMSRFENMLAECTVNYALKAALEKG